MNAFQDLPLKSIGLLLEDIGADLKQSCLSPTIPEDIAENLDEIWNAAYFENEKRLTKKFQRLLEQRKPTQLMGYKLERLATHRYIAKGIIFRLQLPSNTINTTNQRLLHCNRNLHHEPKIRPSLSRRT